MRIWHSHLLSYKFSASRVSLRTNVFAATAKTIYKLVNYLLLYKTHIDEVEERREDLEYVTSDDFLKKTSVIKMESLRVNLRDLMRYIEKEVIEPIITDFNDVISSTEDAEDEDVDFSTTVDDFKTFDEKVIYFAKTHSEKVLIQQIENLQKPTAEAIAEMKEDVRSFAKDDAEYEALFPNDEALVIFLRKNLDVNQSAIQLFITKEKSRDFTDRMCAYAKELLTFMMENGALHKEDLLRDELNFGDLFDSNEIQTLLSDIEDIL